MVAKHNKEVETLKKELADLKAAYERDMALISSDIQTLNSQISPSDPQ
jgi:archaellum component FlaC